MTQERISRRFGAVSLAWLRLARLILPMVLLLSSFLYVWLRVQPALEYHSLGPYFYCHRPFLNTFLGRAGGLTEYVGILLSQLSVSSAMGALVFVALQGALWLACRNAVAASIGCVPGVLALVPAYVLLLLRNRYGCPVLAIGLGLVLALVACAAWCRWPWRRWWGQAVCSAVISSLLFVLAGLWPPLVFAVLGGLYLGIQRRSGGAAAGVIFLAMVAPAAAFSLWGASTLWWSASLSGAGESILVAILYTSVPAAALLLIALPKMSRMRPNGAGTASQTGALPHAGFAVRVARPNDSAGLKAWLPEAGLGQAGIALGFVVGAMVVGLTFDGRQKIQRAMDYHLSRGEYDQVLAAARKATMLNHPAKVRLQFALYHAGRLGDDLFAYLNLIGEAPLNGLGEDWRAQSQPLFELGLVNDAEHMAHEALELEGDRPDLLRLLARINFVKERPQAAQVFLNVLSLIPFQEGRCNPEWPVLAEPVPAEERALLAEIRARMMTNDVPHDSAGAMLDVLLASNPNNQMAFEYVMAHYLTNLDLRLAVERLALLDNFHYSRIPRSYEEALLLYQQLARVEVSLNNGRTVRPATVERFRQFKAAARQSQGTAHDLAQLAADFGDTYWCFYYANLNRPRAARLSFP